MKLHDKGMRPIRFSKEKLDHLIEEMYSLKFH